MEKYTIDSALKRLEEITESLEKGELFTLRETDLLTCVILNSEHNEGYEGVKWLARLAGKRNRKDSREGDF